MKWEQILLDGLIAGALGVLGGVGTTYWVIHRGKLSDRGQKQARTAEMAIAILSQVTGVLIEALATDDYQTIRAAHREVQKSIGTLTALLGRLGDEARHPLQRLPELVNFSAYPQCGPGFTKAMRDGTIEALNTISELTSICGKVMLEAA